MVEAAARSEVQVSVPEFQGSEQKELALLRGQLGAISSTVKDRLAS